MRSTRDILGSKIARPKEIDWANEPYNPSGSISRRQLYALLADMNGAADPAEVLRLHNLPFDAVTKELAALKEELGLSSEDLQPDRMSALPPKADILGVEIDVRQVP